MASSLKTIRPVIITRDVVSRRFSDIKPVPTRYNTITEDKTAFVCYHPKVITPYEETQPIRPYKLLERSRHLTHDEISFVKQLRNDEPFVWSVNVLASLFNVPKQVICESAPLNKENREMVIRESELKKGMSFYQRKKFIERNNEKRKIQLKKSLENIDYNFPGKLPDAYN